MPRPAKYPRETMLKRALELFWTKGYGGTSIHDLLQELDIHRGTLYDSFEDKHALFMEVLAYYQQLINDRLLLLLTQPGAKKAAIHQLFQQLVTWFATEKGQRGCLLTNTLLEVGLSDPQATAFVMQDQAALTAAFQQALVAAQQAGELPLRSPAQVQALALFLVNTTQGLRVMARTCQPQQEMQQVVAIALQALE